MRITSSDIRKAYSDALTGLTFEGNPVGIYDAIASEDAKSPYIILSSQTSNEVLNKHTIIHSATILVDVVYKIQGVSGRIKAEQLAQLVLDRVLINADLSANYTEARVRLISDTDLTTQSGNAYLYRKLLRFEHTISEK